MRARMYISVGIPLFPVHPSDLSHIHTHARARAPTHTGVEWDDWRGRPTTAAGGANAADAAASQQQQTIKRRRLLLASLRQPDGADDASGAGAGTGTGGSKKAAGGSGGGAAMLMGGETGGLQQLATAPRPVPRLGARAKKRGELLSRPPVSAHVVIRWGGKQPTRGRGLFVRWSSSHT